ncbi:hypothetical protein [Polaromonas naphthalenivorans]|uniref:Uncharacterized protein n=1 Tax=Polaromonas naphthalenivorans (strain CJ2) TaxID=365044 RepID=A1VUS2_POLNA|nr:hypothetical protein [Polaromonas naphthalenivorans]ABM39400.1 conserved hypothetical protein [Polaromonas naphthalenivorans CJ2]
MFFFSWFSGKSRQAKHASMPRGKLPPAGAQRGELDDGSSKTKNHDSREKLYEAIREVMTHSGILSASYKFKVLDLDRRSSSYLVMIDLTSSKGDAVLQPAELETLIVQRAMVRYEIVVSAVYWRLNEIAVVSKLSPPSASAVFPLPTQAVNKKEFLQEPIQADEVAAFRLALLAASAHSSPVSPEKSTKASSGLRRSAHLLDFEDTEVTQSFSYPALSNTQYGDLH